MNSLYNQALKQVENLRHDLDSLSELIGGASSTARAPDLSGAGSGSLPSRQVIAGLQGK